MDAIGTTIGRHCTDAARVDAWGRAIHVSARIVNNAKLVHEGKIT